jgi:ribosomal protein S19E (S16A)
MRTLTEQQWNLLLRFNGGNKSVSRGDARTVESLAAFGLVARIGAYGIVVTPRGREALHLIARLDSMLQKSGRADTTDLAT